MAEGFILNISKEMLQRLDAADKKIVQIGESAEKAMKKINEAFGKKLTGVEDFIKQLNDIQQQLSKKDLKVNVDLALKNGALDSLKKQIEALGITIPVGVTATGTGGSNSAGAVPNGLNEALSRIATTIDAMNKTLTSVVNIQEKMVNSNTQQGGKGRSNNTAQVQDPINFSQNAKSITERIQAIKLLQKEMFNLDTTDKNYRTTLNNLNTELTRQQTVLKNLGIEIGKIKMPKIETHKPDFAPLREEYKKNQDELKKLQSEYDKVAKKIRETEVQIANIKAGKGGMYNPTEYTENLKKRQNLSDEIKLYQDENKLITDKMRLLNQEYQAKVKVQQANNPKNIALIEKEKKEYEKLLKTISQLEKTKQKADRDIAKHGVNSAIGRKADVVSQQTYQQIQEANKRKLDLERKYGTDLLQIQQANNVKELEEVRRQGNEEIREYEKVRSKILEINKTLYENSKTLKNTKDPNLQAQINNQNQALLNERSKLATRQLELERKHGNSLLSVQTQIGQREVEFERKKQQDKIREVQQALRRRQDIERRWAQRNARFTEQKRNTADGALSFSQNEAKTIGQKLQAIKYLQNAQKSLDVTTSKGRSKFNELNREIKKTENELRRCGVQMNNFQEKSRHLFDITGQLGRALSLMFSVSQITQYVSKMVNVRKEMELQQRSLQVLLQSKDKANELWNQTLDLAVKSPFRVKELVTYTKQLAAYRIESDKLFETNKMLADVSAGLGVDMQRLILAFGQVKSASFLRGCLGKGTPIRLYNEDIKEVQNIVVGDVIMGDDNTPRNVKEIIYGKEQMYIVKQGALGDDYRVNENHILTLKDNITATIIDVYVKDYLKDKERYNGVKISANGNIIDYPIELIKDNIDEYFGFVIDGNKRFLLGDGTITHNTELRQFTEAGIPMLEELSKYFSEIYGKSVSVAEVFDMISKRMVTFTDVETVFKRMTGAGGVFFNMQEELAQTTAGLISNLQDSIDLMFNEMGKKNQGLINDVIKAARYLVDNWETVGKVMKGALLTLLLYKAATMDISKITKGWGANVKAAFSLLKENPLEFFQAFKGNIIMTALTAIIALVIKVVREHNKYKRAIEEVNKAHEKFRKSVSDVEIGFSEMFQNGNDNIDEYRDKLQELIGIAQQSYNIEIDFKVNELESIDEVSRKFDDLKEKILSFNQLSLEFSLDFVERDDRGWEWFQDYLGTDINQLSESQKSISRIFYEMRTNMSSALKEYYKYKRTAENFVPDEIFESFSSQDLDTETSYDFFKRNVQAINNLLNKVVKSAGYTSSTALQIAIDNDDLSQTKYEDISNILKQYGFEFETQDKLIGFINNLIYKYDDYESKLGEATKELTAFYQTTNDDISLLVAELEKNENLTPAELNKRLSEYIYNAIKNIATTKELDPLVLDEMLSQAEKYYKEQEQFGFELDLLPKIKTADPIQLKQWQQTFNEEVKKVVESISGKMKTEEYDYDLFGVFSISEDLQGLSTTETKKLAELNQALDAAVKRREEILGKQRNKSPLFKQEELDDINLYIEKLTYLRDLVGGDDDKSKDKDTATQRIKDQISLIRQLYEEYQKLSNEMGATTAKGNVLSRFADYAKELGLNIEDIDFTNLKGIFDALQGLETSAKSAGADAMKALTKAMGETSVELELMFYMDERNQFENQIKDMFSDYELSLELDKLNIPKNLASQLFGVDTVDLYDIKTELENKLNDLDSADISLTQQLEKEDIDDNLKQSLLLQQKGNKQLREQTEANLQKISDMEKKELEERLKTYTKYLLSEQHERVKIRMETLRMLQEVEDTEEYTPAQRQTITDKIKEEERKKLAQQTWKDFEQSPMYMQMFDDVENMGKGALESLITQMGTLKDELQSMGLPASDLKEILGAINKAEEELERRNPFKNFAKNAEIAFNRSKKLEEYENKRIASQDRYDSLSKEYDTLQEQLSYHQNILGTLNKESKEYEDRLSLINALQLETNKVSKELEEEKWVLIYIINLINNINDSSNDFYDQLKNIGSITKSVVDGIFQITDAMSWLPEETQLTIDRLQSLSNNVLGIAGGIGSIMSGNIIAGITQLIGSLSGLIATFIEWSSGTKEATIQIERQGRILSNLQNKYDRLNEAIDEAWDTRQIKEYNAELEKNLQQQIIAQQNIIAAQESKKGSDEYGSEQWLELQEARDELQNLYDMQEDLQDNIYEKITGGIIDNTLDAISSWVDAWYDAFKETGDGLKGLEENFNEMLLNLVKRQAVMKVAGRFIDQWNSVLERYVNNDDNLSLGEITSWANMIEQDLPALSSQLETFFKAFDGILGDTQGNLSGLQRGISSITESQADILASYLNSIRFIVSDSNAQLRLLVSAQTGNTPRSENPMVEQLRVIAQQTSAINTLLNSLTAPHPTLSGRGLKVVI